MGMFPFMSRSSYDSDIYESTSRSIDDGNCEYRSVRTTTTTLGSEPRYISMSYVGPTDANPNPNKFDIVKAYGLPNFFALKVNYPNCTNYEGNKILVYEGDIVKLLNQKHIDPHFSDNEEFMSPICRFEPTDRGWEWAVEFVNKLAGAEE